MVCGIKTRTATAEAKGQGFLYIYALSGMCQRICLGHQLRRAEGSMFAGTEAIAKYKAAPAYEA